MSNESKSFSTKQRESRLYKLLGKKREIIVNEEVFFSMIASGEIKEFYAWLVLPYSNREAA